MKVTESTPELITYTSFETEVKEVVTLSTQIVFEHTIMSSTMLFTSMSGVVLTTFAIVNVTADAVYT